MKALGKVGMAVVLWFMPALIHDMSGKFFTVIDRRGWEYACKFESWIVMFIRFIAFGKIFIYLKCYNI